MVFAAVIFLNDLFTAVWVGGLFILGLGGFGAALSAPMSPSGEEDRL